jgi:hypothetical protein
VAGDVPRSPLYVAGLEHQTAGVDQIKLCLGGVVAGVDEDVQNGGPAVARKGNLTCGNVMESSEFLEISKASINTENGLVLYLVTSEVTSGLRLYTGSYELRVTGTSGFRCENIELWEKV